MDENNNSSEEKEQKEERQEEILINKDIEITDVAKKAFIKFLSDKDSESPYVRVGIRGGGCSGLSYVLEIGDLREADHVIYLGESNYNLVIDPKSFIFLKNVILDYKIGLMDAGFKFIHPVDKDAKACGCGESFSV